MSKTANVYTRVDPEVKERAEVILSQLGISMATAMEMYLRQIVFQRKIPFEMALPADKPIALGALSDAEFDALMHRAVQQYQNGECTSLDEFKKELHEEFGI